jgi:DmsE family decaheme c-type cytochrome
MTRILGVLSAGLLVMTVQLRGQQPPGYAGEEACQACHEDIYNAFIKSPHHGPDAATLRAWQGRVCEACHGPGEKHAQSGDASAIVNPARAPAEASSRACLTCHLHTPAHAGRLESSHAKNQVACAACHKVHANGGAELLMRRAADINQQCARCHTNVIAQFRKPFRHRLPEAAMSCVDCHNPHGSIRNASLRNFGANDPGCFACHGDKRGPFTFEHPPMRFEGCSACHEPHGSTNPRMLIRHEVRFVCLECHANLPTPGPTAALGVTPPAFHNLLSPRFQNCTICHQKVHGSHIDRNLLR